MAERRGGGISWESIKKEGQALSSPSSDGLECRPEGWRMSSHPKAGGDMVRIERRENRLGPTEKAYQYRREDWGLGQFIIHREGKWS